MVCQGQFIDQKVRTRKQVHAVQILNYEKEVDSKILFCVLLFHMFLVAGAGRPVNELASRVLSFMTLELRDVLAFPSLTHYRLTKKHLSAVSQRQRSWPRNHNQAPFVYCGISLN